jgi:uncharacterized protein involved in exopolysaccharide biosynthesis
MSSPLSADPEEPMDFETTAEFLDATPPRSARSMKPKRLLFDLVARWHWIVLGLTLGLLGSAYYLAKTPKAYSATASLCFKPQSATVTGRDQVDEIVMRSIKDLNTVSDKIRRPELLEQVAQRADVRELPGLVPPAVDWWPGWLANQSAPRRVPLANQALPAPLAFVEMLSSWMTVSIRGGTRQIDITFTHEVPAVAAALADAVAREYLSEFDRSIIETPGSKWYADFKRGTENSAKIAAVQRAMESYEGVLKLHQLLEAQQHVVAGLERRLLPDHPNIIAANAELESLKRRFLEEFGVAVASPADEAYWKTSRTAIQAPQDDSEARLQIARPLLLARHAMLKAEFASWLTYFNSMLNGSCEHLTTRAGGEYADFTSFASVPGKPSSPQPAKVFTTGAAAGLAAGLALAFLPGRTDRRRRSFRPSVLPGRA